jgi:hypothetical protein
VRDRTLIALRDLGSPNRTRLAGGSRPSSIPTPQLARVVGRLAAALRGCLDPARRFAGEHRSATWAVVRLSSPRASSGPPTMPRAMLYNPNIGTFATAWSLGGSMLETRPVVGPGPPRPLTIYRPGRSAARFADGHFEGPNGRFGLRRWLLARISEPRFVSSQILFMRGQVCGMLIVFTLIERLSTQRECRVFLV